MPLLATIILPHGAMPYDGDPNSDSTACRDRNALLDPVLRENLSSLYDGICAAAQTIADLQPDLVILNSPHGITLSDSLAVYTNDAADGNALWLGEWSEFAVSVTMDAVRSLELKNFFEANNVPVQGIRTWGNMECKLRWGEAIPIWYLNKYMATAPKYVITTNDYLPKPGAVEDWRLDAGKKLADFVDQLPEKVVVAISGDNAHYHPTDETNPLYLPASEMPVNEEGASAYEADIAAWVTNGNSKEKRADGAQRAQPWDPETSYPYLSAAIQVDPNAGACGSKGYVLAHGLLSKEVENGASFTSDLVVHRVPTYYGMMAATFIKN